MSGSLISVFLCIGVFINCIVLCLSKVYFDRCFILLLDFSSVLFLDSAVERLLLNHMNTPGFLAPGGEEFNPGPETRLDRSELLCNKVLLKYKGDRESF